VGERRGKQKKMSRQAQRNNNEEEETISQNILPEGGNDRVERSPDGGTHHDQMDGLKVSSAYGAEERRRAS
jgi:hypothetical protein